MWKAFIIACMILSSKGKETILENSDLGRPPCRPHTQFFCYLTLELALVQAPITSIPEHCQKILIFFFKHANYFFPRCCFTEWHFREGGKVIKGLGLEKPFYFSSYWAGVNKDSLNVNNDLINRHRWQCQEKSESKSSSLPVIKLDYTGNI